MQAFYECSEVVFSITKDVGDYLFPGDPDRKIMVFYEGIEEESVFISSTNEHNDLDPGQYLYQEKGARVGAFAYIGEGKGQLDLVNALIGLIRKGISIFAYLVGPIVDEKYFHKIDCRIKESGFTDYFILTGHIANPYELMKKMDIVVSNSWMEAAGRTLIEAALLRIPIIYPNSGGPNELYTDGVHGYSYKVGGHEELETKILAVLNDPQKAQQMSKNAYLYVKSELNPEKYANRFLKGFHQLFKEQADKTISYVRINQLLGIIN
jgi:glycosyltransferase involved in cell wall biosynthesis